LNEHAGDRQKISKPLKQKPIPKDEQREASRQAILSAAERVFATFGYEGASMRRIAHEAGMAQALLHYYFQTKENLYEEVFERRATPTNAFRVEEIDKLLSGSKPPDLNMLLDVLFAPAKVPDLPQAASTSFSQLVSSAVVADDERSRLLVTRHYDPIARAFISAFRRVLPALTESDAAWAYLFAHAARMQIYAQSGRAQRLGVEAAQDDLEQPLMAVKSFVSAGIRALAGGR
jgi:AcrR family transcriptional regulator